MPAPIDDRLIDPTPSQLVQSLVKATRAANTRLKERRLDKDVIFWHRLVYRVFRQAEGDQQWCGGRGGWPAALVKLSWWTDAIGRRHWRVQGRRFNWTDDRRHHLPGSSFPLWNVYPERILVRWRDGVREVVALCPCGVVGTPRRIAWTGTMCGPCHDRLEEGAPSADAAFPPTLRRHTQMPTHVAFLPQGQLVSGGRDGRIILWDIDSAASRILLHRSRGTVHALTAAADSTILGSTSYFRLLLRRPGQDDWRVIPINMGSSHAPLTSPDSRWAVVSRGNGCWLVDLHADELAPRPLLAGAYVSGAAFSPDGKQLFLVDALRGLFYLDVSSGQAVLVRGFHPDPLAEEDWEGIHWTFHGNHLAMSPDGQWLMVVGSWDDWSGPHLCHLPTRRWYPLREELASGIIQSAAFTPDGMLALVWQSGAVQLWDPRRQALHAWLQVRMEWPHVHIQLSPEGDRLATMHSDGAIVVLPWRRLLEEG